MQKAIALALALVLSPCDARDIDLGSASDGGVDNGDGVDATVVDAGDLPNFAAGWVYFEQCSGSPLCPNQGTSSSPAGRFDVFAGFYPAPWTSDCSTTVYEMPPDLPTGGACLSFSCATPAMPLPPTPLPPVETLLPPTLGAGPGYNRPGAASAGTLTVGGIFGDEPTRTLTLLPGSTNTYTYETSMWDMTSGVPVSVSASGATFPAFAQLSVMPPPVPGLVAPAADAAGNFVIPTSTDLALSWNTASLQANFFATGMSSDARDYFVCDWQASRNVGVIPRAVLAPFAGQSGDYFLYGQSTSNQSASALGSNVMAVAVAYGGGTATFEP